VSRSSPPRCRARRYTLLELIISLAIFAAVAGLIFAAGTSVTRSWSRLTARQSQFAELMTLDRTLDMILSNALPFVWRDDDGQKEPCFKGEGDRLTLAYRHRVTNLQDGGIRFVVLHQDGDRLLATYQQRPPLLPGEMGVDSKESVLAKGVDEVFFSYADYEPEKGVSWENSWDPNEWEPVREELPLGIMVEIRWLDGREEAWLRRTPGSGWGERLGDWKPRVDQPAGP